jgi:hypothetical protein
MSGCSGARVLRVAALCLRLRSVQVFLHAVAYCHVCCIEISAGLRNDTIETVSR